MRMALLPLEASGRSRENGVMTTNNLLRRMANTIREMNDAVRLTTELRLSRGLGFGDEAPATYAEFLLRTSATSAHEPSAARRQAAGRERGPQDRSCRC
jgi:hypothetical protein